MRHTTVLLNEMIDLLAIKPGDTVVDGTLGSAGHLEQAVKQSEGKIKAIGIDRDPDALERSKEILGDKATLLKGNFRNIGKILKEAGIEKVSKIILDFGLSSEQIDESGRGFTFKKDEPLSMLMEKETSDSWTAKDIVNTWSEESIANIIFGYGEERYARRIAGVICEERAKKPIETTFELSEIIAKAVPKNYEKGRVNPSTRTFQALRIAVNDELGAIKQGIREGFEILEIGGRMGAISFHSLEDREVKSFFKEKEKEGVAKLITKKPIEASLEEVAKNSRSRSAKLRVIEKIK